MIGDLIQQLKVILGEHPDGIAEHRLLKRLQRDNPDHFPARLFADDLALFRAHFLLFHALYKLRDSWFNEGRGALEIDPRAIRLVPQSADAGEALAAHDPMRSYYLDLNNLTDTTADNVATLLGDFWVRYYAGSRRTEALAVLGLTADADLGAAQRRYRELAMTHHPDRGGDSEAFREIQEAIAVLRRC